MKPPLGLNRIIATAYTTAARIGDFSSVNDNPWLTNIGVEINMSSNFGYQLFPFTITAGVAKGFNDKGEVIPYLEIYSGL
ncbi:MAG: hypothetical protein R3240_10275, partial [Gammaproteobacteria bacterium]|nr:hypothetical protein [Gammaproteobacteria bacterium]